MTSNKGKAPKSTSTTTVPRSEKKAKKDKKVASKAADKSPSFPPVEVSKSSESETEDEDEEDDGIDEEGMTRLMELLGDDGLDEFDQAQLQALAGSDDEEEDGQQEGEGEENSVSEEKEQDTEMEALSDADEDEEDGAEIASDAENDAEEGNEDDEDEEIALDEVDSVDEDAVPRQKVEIDNKVALDEIRESIKLDPSLPWTETLVLSYPETIDVDVNDDLNRELAFYKQALHGANVARALAAKHNFPFTRPSDYFAEMIKSDAHMERIRQRLLNEAAGIKKSEDKRKEREGKKFGKQVQVEKLKERERNKKEMEERLKGLKRKRKDVLDNPQANDDEFDIAVEDAISDHPAKRGKGANGKSMPRSVRDKKFGFGGSTRRAKQNTRESTDNFDAANAGRGRGGGRGGRGGRGGARGGRGGGRHSSKRLGKSKRVAAKSK